MKIEQYNLLLQSLKDKEYFILAIDGMSASGKSTLASALQHDLDATLIHCDDFFLPFELRTKERLCEPGGNIDYVRFKNEIVSHLNEDIVYQPFSCKLMSLQNPIKLPKSPRIIIEGAYALHPYFGHYYTDSIFLKISKEEQIRRIEIRNKEMVTNFINKWIPMENNYFEAYQIEQKVNRIYINEE